MEAVPLPTDDDSLAGALQSALAGSPDAEPGYLVMLARQEEMPREKVVAAFAEAFHLDVYTAGQWLSSPWTRILRREPSQAAAQRWLEWLEKARLRCFAATEEELTGCRFLPHVVAYKEKGGLLFEDEKGARRPVRASDVLCLVAGEVRERIFELPAGSGPVVARASSGAAIAAHNWFRIDLHLRPENVAIRLEQDGFRFSALFPEATGASGVLIREVLGKLRRGLPKVPVHEDFHLAEDAIGRSRKVCESSARIAAWWNSTPGKAKVLESNARAFDLYSVLARLERLRA